MADKPTGYQKLIYTDLGLQSSDVERHDLLLGDLAIEKNLLTLEQVEECLDEQREAKRSGKIVPLGQIFLRRGLLEMQQVSDLLKEQKEQSSGIPYIPRYEIERVVGQGAMATVYRARDTELDRHVALKVLRDKVSEIGRQRFQREAQAAAALNHPNVVAVHDMGVVGRRMYLVLELVRGKALSDILGGRKYEVKEMVELVEKAARGVGAAHEQGVVHRDLKPANILVTREGDPKVGDFGLAHLLGEQASLTKTGTTLGTPMYMAPEQAKGNSELISTRTDVYGLGAILYEVLTGRPPHTGETLMEIYGKISNEDPLRPRLINPKIDAEVETICLKALEKDPVKRYANAREFADDLGRHRTGEAILATPSGLWTKARKWSKRHRTLGAALVVGFISALLVIGTILFHALERSRNLNDWLAGAKIGEQQYQKLLLERDGLLKERTFLEDQLKPDSPVSKRKSLWEIEAAIDEKEGKLAQQHNAFVAAYYSALGLDARNAEARAALAKLYYGEFEEAERFRNRKEMAVKEQLVRVFDDGEYAPRLVRQGTIQIDTRPSGAEVELYRFEPGADRRLMPVLKRSLGSAPIASTKLEGGSYLLILKKEGYRDVRYPVRVGRGTQHQATVNLYTDDEIGADFVYVPAGTFIQGGDPEAWVGHPYSEETHVADFFISRHEVTISEYAEFLLYVLKAEGKTGYQRHAPRRQEGAGYIKIFNSKENELEIVAGMEDFPVFGVHIGDASTYCRWKSSEARKRGETVSYRLPTGQEWEKSVRGVDGRIFPWGHHFEWMFLSCAYTVDWDRGRPIPSGVGHFEKDQSVYGVRDMTGSIREWTREQGEKDTGYFVVRGGGYNANDAKLFRPTSRFVYEAGMLSGNIGFRVVREPPPR